MLWLRRILLFSIHNIWPLNIATFQYMEKNLREYVIELYSIYQGECMWITTILPPPNKLL